MKKSIVALAIAGIFAIPSAMAVEVNGAINIGLDRSKTSGSATSSDNVSATSIESGNTRLSMSHSQDLDNGMVADVFVELHYPLTVANGNIQNRNSTVGLSGDFGSVRFGTNENAYERMIYAHNYHEGDWKYGPISIMGVAPAGAGNDAQMRSHIWDRTNNTLIYKGPDGPMAIELDYAFGGSNTTATRTPSLLSMALEYTMGGGVGLWAGYQVATDWAGNSATPTAARDDTALIFGASFGLGSMGFHVAMETMEWKDTTNNVTTERSAWKVEANYPMATGRIGVSYAVADDSDEDNAGTNTTTDDGADTLTVGYYHPMGPGVQLFAMYSKTTNDPAGTYNFAIFQAGAGTAGMDYTNYIFGISVGF